jgi:cobalt-zinc-cadmium efflux system membrane fusion protein
MKVLYVLTALILLSACGKHTEEAKQEKLVKQEEHNPTYRYEQVNVSDAGDELILNGEVTFDESNVVHIFPLVSGNVESIKVELGEFVRKGQELGVIKSADVTNYVKDYEIDKANLEISRKALQNAETLFKSGFASETDVLTARKEFEKAQQEVLRSQEVLRIYGGATSADKPFYVVKAPISGYIVDKNVNTGQEMRPDNAEPMFTISNLGNVWVLANVYEADIEVIRLNQEVEIQTLSYPDKVFKGKISNISSVLDANSRVMKVRIDIPNSNGLLKPDMFATVHLHLHSTQSHLSIPLRALVFDSDAYYVIAERNGKLEKVEVEVLKRTSQRALVKGALKPGEKVVTEGSLLAFNELNN